MTNPTIKSPILTTPILSLTEKPLDIARLIDRWCYIGLDLGQRRDYTAIAIVERAFEPYHWDVSKLRQTKSGKQWYIVRSLERLRLGTPYPDVVERLRQITQMPFVKDGCTIVVDGTGVGAPVVDLIRRAGITGIVPVIITGGERTNTGLSGGYTSVPRSLLLTGLQVAIQENKLVVAANCREAQTLERELMELKLAGTKSSEIHDDMAFAVALAIWKARQAGV